MGPTILSSCVRTHHDDARQLRRLTAARPKKRVVYERKVVFRNIVLYTVSHSGPLRSRIFLCTCARTRRGHGVGSQL